MTGIQPLFRFATPEDLPGIGKLWLEETEWGALPPEFAQLFALAPGGAPRTLVAVDQSDGTILGQCGFVPTTIKAGEQLIKGVRPHSTIVSKAYSAAVKTFDLTVQPAAAMYVNGLRLLRDDGCKLAYMVPHPRWAPLFRLQPRTEITSFPLHSVALPVPASLQLPAGCTASPVETWDKSIDDLSERWSPQYECGLVRTAEVLAWKASIGYYRSLAVRQGDELVGVVVIRTKGDRMWQICDMLTADAGETLGARSSQRSSTAQPMVKWKDSHRKRVRRSPFSRRR